MEKITSIEQLKEAILVLEIKQASEGALLKEQFKLSYESLKPANLIKNVLKDLTSLPDLKGDLLDTTISLAAGFLSKKAAIGSTHNPLKQLLGTLLQMGVTSIVSKNTDGIKSTIMSLISTFLRKKETVD